MVTESCLWSSACQRLSKSRLRSHTCWYHVSIQAAFCNCRGSAHLLEAAEVQRDLEGRQRAEAERTGSYKSWQLSRQGQRLCSVAELQQLWLPLGVFAGPREPPCLSRLHRQSTKPCSLMCTGSKRPLPPASQPTDRGGHPTCGGTSRSLWLVGAAETTVLNFLGGNGKEETGLDASFFSLPEALPFPPRPPAPSRTHPG